MKIELSLTREHDFWGLRCYEIVRESMRNRIEPVFEEAKLFLSRFGIDLGFLALGRFLALEKVLKRFRHDLG